MAAASKALVVGGGVAGMSAAIMLRQAGLEVNLIDLAPDWKMAGAGLTISASTLRAFQKIGVLEQVMTLGHTHAGIQVCDVQGQALRKVESPPLPDADVPGAGLSTGAAGAAAGPEGALMPDGEEAAGAGKRATR